MKRMDAYTFFGQSDAFINDLEDNNGRTIGVDLAVDLAEKYLDYVKNVERINNNISTYPPKWDELPLEERMIIIEEKDKITGFTVKDVVEFLYQLWTDDDCRELMSSKVFSQQEFVEFLNRKYGNNN